MSCHKNTVIQFAFIGNCSEGTSILTSWRSIRWPQTAVEAWTFPCTQWWGSLGPSLAPPWGSSCSFELDSERKRHGYRSSTAQTFNYTKIKRGSWFATVIISLGEHGVFACVSTGFYLHRGLEGGGMRVVRQALAVALLFHTQQDLDVLTVLIAAGLLVTLHPRLDLVLPQRRVLRWLLLWSCTLRKKMVQLLVLIVEILTEDDHKTLITECVVYLYSGGLSGPLSEGLPEK